MDRGDRNVWLASARQLLDFLEIGGNDENIGRNVDSNVSAFGYHSGRSLVSPALDPEDETGQIARVKPRGGLGARVGKELSLLIHSARMAVDYH
jgi:hypothetical protein